MNTKAAKCFLNKILKNNKDWHPQKIHTDKNPAYGAAINKLKVEGKLGTDVIHKYVEYLNNIIEAQHSKLKMLIKPLRGF